VGGAGSGLSPSPAWGAVHSPAVWGIYLLFMACGSSPRTREGAGGSGGRCWQGGGDTGGPTGDSRPCPSFACAQTGLLARPPPWWVAAGTGLDGAGGPGIMCVSRRWGGGHRGAPGGCICRRGPNAVSRFFFLSSCSHSAFWLCLPLSGPLGLGEVEGRRRGSRGPPGWAGDALSLLLPFNKLVFL